MKVILRKDVPGLGKSGTVVQVRDGYGRNYLIPQQLAYSATSENMGRGQAEAKKQVQEELKRHEQLVASADKVRGASVTITAHAGEEGKLFGSVNAQSIVDALAEQGHETDKKWVELEAPIRDLGVFPVIIRFSPDVTAEIKVWVVKG